VCGQCSQEAGLDRLATLLLQTVCGISELNIQVEDARRHWPAQHLEARQLSGGGESNKQSIGTYWKWRSRPELISPQMQFPTASKLLCNHANRYGPFTSVRDELEIDGPLLEW
jgi:hypothetical protein